MEDLESKNISNAWAYAAAGCMVYSALWALSTPYELMIAVNNYFASFAFIFSIVDGILLKQAKIANAPSFWWAIIAPIYYYKRQKVLNQPMTIFYFVLGGFIATLVFAFLRGVIYGFLQATANYNY